MSNEAKKSPGGRGGRYRRDLCGELFGPLLVVCFWGLQSGRNASWVYCCTVCGHVGKRIGSKLKKEVTCVACRSKGPPEGGGKVLPSQDDVDKFFLRDPSPGTGTAAPEIRTAPKARPVQVASPASAPRAPSVRSLFRVDPGALSMTNLCKLMDILEKEVRGRIAKGEDDVLASRRRKRQAS